MRTTTCNRCDKSGVYWKLTKRGKRVLWDVDGKTWHFLICPKSTYSQKQEAEQALAEESSQQPKPIEPSSKPVADGVTEARVREIIAEDRPDVIGASVNAAVREAQKVAERIDRQESRQETDRQTLVRAIAELRADLGSAKSQIEMQAAEIARLRSVDNSAREIEIKRPDGTKVNVGRQHQAFAQLVAYLSADLNVFCAGPAGSGKTEGAKAAAKALGLEFYEQPLNPMLSDSKLTGFMSANGTYVTTAMRQAFEHGGLLLLDEGDNANPSILAGMNALLANGSYGFPDKRVERHPNFRCVLTANTWGHGADRQYVARNQLDAATLNRFVKLPWDYDEEFELAIAGNVEWTRYVQRVRKVVFKHKLRYVISPRQSIFGAKLLAIGRPREEVEMAVIWADIPEDARQQIRAGLAA